MRCPNELIFSCSFEVYLLFFSVASPFLSDYSINTEKLKQINIISFNIIVNEHHSKLGESLEVSAVFGKQQFCLCYNFDTI